MHSSVTWSKSAAEAKKDAEVRSDHKCSLNLKWKGWIVWKPSLLFSCLDVWSMYFSLMEWVWFFFLSEGPDASSGCGNGNRAKLSTSTLCHWAQVNYCEQAQWKVIWPGWVSQDGWVPVVMAAEDSPALRWHKVHQLNKRVYQKGRGLIRCYNFNHHQRIHIFSLVSALSLLSTNIPSKQVWQGKVVA